MSRRWLAIGALALMAVAVLAVWRVRRAPAAPTRLVLYGNVDLRQVDLPFNGTERITEVLVQEGDRVHAGQVVARLDTRRLAPQVAQTEAQAASQRQVVARLRHGNRPEEVAQALAAVASAQADAANARQRYDRLASLAESHIVSQQDVDNAKAALDVADAKLMSGEKALALEVAGPRAEDIAQAEDQLRGYEAQLALLRQELADAVLTAPSDGVVRARLLEPGEMASPTKPVISLAITNPKWIRAYVPEPDLGRVRSGMDASVAVDAFPHRVFSGWVGFISSVAEFTPKEVQTEALRPSLVYEVRVFVRDSADALRLGMPATVALSLPRADDQHDTRPATPVPVLRESAQTRP